MWANGLAYLFQWRVKRKFYNIDSGYAPLDTEAHNKNVERGRERKTKWTEMGKNLGSIVKMNQKQHSPSTTSSLQCRSVFFSSPVLYTSYLEIKILRFLNIAKIIRQKFLNWLSIYTFTKHSLLQTLKNKRLCFIL